MNTYRITFTHRNGEAEMLDYVSESQEWAEQQCLHEFNDEEITISAV